MRRRVILIGRGTCIRFCFLLRPVFLPDWLGGFEHSTYRRRPASFPQRPVKPVRDSLRLPLSASDSDPGVR